jgi:hypothetical protein
LNIGPIMVQTIRHFLPELNDWIDEIEDPRFPPLIIYSKRFMVWWGLMLFLPKLSSRRQLDFQLSDEDTNVLANLNRLAGSKQTTRPVNKTLENFLGGIRDHPVAVLRKKAVNRLIRMKVLDDARVQGRFLVAVDGSGYLSFRQKHCEHCLTRKHGETTTYMHQALEAKVGGPAKTVFSIGTEFIDNRDTAKSPAGSSEDRVKQDCELKALRRLMPKIRADFPQLRICLNGDALFACGEGFQIAKDNHCDYIYVFKQGRLPALWDDFQALLALDSNPPVEVWTAKDTRQEYRWVGLQYTDSDNRRWSFTGIHYREFAGDNIRSEWAWVTSLKVNAKTVVEIATTGGRERWRIENEGFNAQKNDGMNMEHAYSHANYASYYLLMQIAHLVIQLVEKGSLLRQLAQQAGQRTAVKLFGSLKNMADRLLESLRNLCWPDEVFDSELAGKIQIRFDTS